ncbi:unannotated protein [freshwater metagenome]|uniref:Unannotated protein n=1 Tax=freshwater metagenome TaxID=449393 RepID=A0A6J6UAR1_9ZZZZ|nr:DUF2867 domain-containing protein [Actinomycetota bacterium]
MVSTGISLHSSRRVSTVPLGPDEVWAVVAGAGPGRHWYADAAPFVLRGAIDRAVLGGGRRWPVPDGPLLRAGDRAGFWVVRAAGDRPGGHRLVLEAAVRAPGTVTLTVLVTGVGTAAGPGTEIDLQVRLDPRGVLGAAYLLADLPAREAVVELTHRRLVTDVTHAAAGSGA